jgi:REP element-mobilizing transposase RayT
LLELRAHPDRIQMLFSVTPHVSPIFFTQRVKGRLQHALHAAGTPMTFSRKVAFRSLGENTSETVAQYIQGQVGKEEWSDPRYREILQQFTVRPADVRLEEASETNSGRYWYNLHVVLVVAGRDRITNPAVLTALRDTAFATAEAEGHCIAACAIMPDHVHLSLRGNLERKPQEIALAFQNRLAHAAGCRVWQDSYYVGTFSEYALDTVRRLAD